MTKIFKYFLTCNKCVIFTNVWFRLIHAFSFIVSDQYGVEDDCPPDAVDCLGARDSRTIHINCIQQYKSCSNRISTAKYSMLSFMPIFLFEQFRRYSNCFFLLIALLQVSWFYDIFVTFKMIMYHITKSLWSWVIN